MASLEFEDYANVWWERVVQRREENLEEAIETWEEMKEVMHARFVPEHYTPFQQAHQVDTRNKICGGLLQGNGNHHNESTYRGG